MEHPGLSLGVPRDTRIHDLRSRGPVARRSFLDLGRLFDPSHPRVFADLGLLLIAFTFVVDYLHMTVDLEKWEESPRARPHLDAGIAFLFWAAYLKGYGTPEVRGC